MRTLNRKQRKALDAWFEQNKDRLTISFDCERDDGFTDLYGTVYEMNPFEVFNRHITDKVTLIMAG